MTISNTGIVGPREFPITVWGLLDEARAADGAARERCLGRLVQRYWKPVYCVIRRAYVADRDDAHQDAKDLTQDFFTSVVFDRDLIGSYDPSRGGFRTLLRTALTRFMNDVARGRNRDKRGGGQQPLSLDLMGADALPFLSADQPQTPEEIFESAWNDALLKDALAELQARLTRDGKQAAFDLFRRYDLDGESTTLSYAALGEQAGLSAAQVRHALESTRRLFREILTDMVRAYVNTPEELLAELRGLIGG